MAGTTNIQPPPSKDRLLYNAVSQKYDVGSYEEFSQKLQDPTKRKAFYDGVGKEFDLGTYDQFQQKIGIKKKEQNTISGVSPSVTTPTSDQTAPTTITSDSEKKVGQKFKNNSVSPDDVGKTNGDGITPQLVSELINSKGKNLSAAKNVPSNNSSQYLVRQKQDVDRQISDLEQMPMSISEYGQDAVNAHRQKIDQLKQRSQYLNGEIQKNYDYRLRTLVPELSDQIKPTLTDADFNPETHTLRPNAVQRIAGIVDADLNKAGENVIDARVSGDLDKKNRTYEDVTRQVVANLNTIPIQKAQQEYAKEFAKDHPKIEAALHANESTHDYFSNTNFDEVKAKVKTQADKSFIEIKDKYWGKNGLFMNNKDMISIQEKYAQLVHDGKMTEDVAKKQIDAEVQGNPALTKIQKNYEGEVRKITENASKQYEQYLIKGLQQKHPEYTIYGDGSVGLAGMSEQDYKKLLQEYKSGAEKVGEKLGAESNEAWKNIANQKAESTGAFWGSLGMSTNSLMEGLNKWWFNKTGWGGDKVRHFEAQDIASPQISESDQAASWNWKGIESLVNPNFYLSGIGQNIPVIAGAAAIGATTRGAGLPEYIEWLASAGLFTGQSSLQTYNQLLTTRDKDGNMLSEADASHYAADQARKDFLPNVVMMALGSGTLIKAKNIVRPTVIGTLGKSLRDVAATQPLFAWQGFNSYSALKEAQGQQADIFDYMQSKEFRDNLVNGLVLGGSFSLIHAPTNFMKSMDDWTRLVHTSPEAEFKNGLSYNYALGQEMSGNGDYLRDALKLHVFNTDPEGLNPEGKKQLADLKNSLLYSTNLDKNIKAGNLDKTNINDLYQAHNLALADQHDYLAEQAAKDGNKSLSDIYKDKAKEYREEAKLASNGDSKYRYLVNAEGQPIFLSGKSFDNLQSSGKIREWLNDGTIKDVARQGDPEFSERYKEYVAAQNESSVEGKDILDHAADLIEQNKEKLGPFYFQAKANPEGFLSEVSDAVKENEENAREQYGDNIVDLSKVLYPITEKEGGNYAATEGQGPQQKGNQQAGEQEHTRVGSPRDEETQPRADSGDSGTNGEGEKVTPKVGDVVQWTSQGADQFDEPKKVTSISDDGKFAFVEGSDTGIPIDQLTISSPKTESHEDEKTEEAQGAEGHEGEQGNERNEMNPEGEPGKETPPGPPTSQDEWPFVEPSKTGIAARIKKEREFDAGVEAPQPGSRLSKQELVDLGRKLLSEGRDPEKIMQNFENDPEKQISTNAMALSVAHLEQLAKATDRAKEEFGEDSKEANFAKREEAEWEARVQPMQAVWSEIGVTQQAATEVETGTLTGFKRSFQEQVGRPMEPEEASKAKDLVDRIKELTEKEQKLTAKIKELTSISPEEKEQRSIKEKAKKTAQKIREKAKLNRPGMFMAATPASLVWDGAVEIVAKTIETGGALADAVGRAIEHIRASDWYKGLSKEKQDRAIKEFSEFHAEEPEVLTPEEKKIKRLEKELEDLKSGIAKQKSPKSEDSDRAKELKEQIKYEKEKLSLNPSKHEKPLTPDEQREQNDQRAQKLAEKFAGKKDNKFTEDEATDVWSHLSENYLDKEVDVPTAVQNTSIDLGMSVEQVLNAMDTPKGGKELSDEMWNIQSEKRKALNSARYLVSDAQKSGLMKALDKVPSVFFTIKTYGHGTVGNITHAGPNIVRPSTWAAYWPNVFKSFGLAYGSKANYERAIFILKNKPNFTTWIKEGLAADPERIYDEYQLMAKPQKKTSFGRGVQWLTDTGTRGFAGLNFMRYDLAEMLYNRSSDAAKSDPNYRKFVAELVNHSTGHSEAFQNSGKVGKALRVVSFAPGLEVSRWQRMIVDPGKAAITFAKWVSGKEVSPAEIAAAKITWQSAGEKIAVYSILLAANAGLLSALGSKQKVNWHDPTQSDWMKFKFNNKTLDVTGNVLSPYRLLYTLTSFAYKANFGRKKDVQRKPGDQESKQIVKQLRYKESPLASDVTDLYTGTDAMGNVLPWSKVKPQKGAHKLTWDELIGQEVLPIPVQAGIGAYHDAMEKKGMSKSLINGIMTGVLLFGIEGATGAKYQDDYSLQKKK